MRKTISKLIMVLAAAAVPLAGAGSAQALSTTAPTGASAPATPSYYHLVNYNGKCLTIANGATGNGVAAEQWTCDSASQQYWELVGLSNSYIMIKNLRTGKCLSILDNSHSSGAAVIQYTCTSSDAWEQWGQILQGGWWPITNVGDALMSMHPSGNGSANGLKMYVNSGTSGTYYWKVGARH